MERLQQYYQEIQRSERLNTVGHLSAAVAHKVKNPLTVVHGFLQLFQEKDSFSKEEKQYIKQMMQELDQTQAILHDFLSLAKPDHKKLEKIDVKKQIFIVVDLLSSYVCIVK
jgi:two-component system, sporulation sensor kinase B